MAKFKTDRYQGKGGFGDVDIEYQVNIDKKTGKFYVDLDGEIKIWADKSRIVADSYVNIVHAYTDLLDKYYSDNTKVEKVILYKLKINDAVSNNLGFYPKTSIGIEYVIHYKLTNSDKHWYADKYPKLQNRGSVLIGGARSFTSEKIETEWKVLVHTEELEEWFKTFQWKLETLIDQVKQYFGDGNSQILLQNIENQMKLLGN